MVTELTVLEVAELIRALADSGSTIEFGRRPSTTRRAAAPTSRWHGDGWAGGRASTTAPG
ncbi:putative nAD-dependent epimerase/dehydratase [Mycobacterium kansasii]|uniref:Putative nAD-dependent epimerase/dehydratase n=1 Tax=Mycobacterium kansasii TaxID=1768 RepID=A0A1V3X0K5_MYCKA|nr:putative nAD-dependent epimerase/dehydratase [Mycobacterium kansasii]